VGKLVTVHQRNYVDPVPGSRGGGAETWRGKVEARLQISHIPPHKGGTIPPTENWERTIALVEKARADGVDVAFDAHPYFWGQTRLRVILPAWAFEGGMEKTLQRTAQPRGA